MKIQAFYVFVKAKLRKGSLEREAEMIRVESKQKNEE